MKILLELSYDGSAYHGWQVQPGAISVQQTLQDACESIFGFRPPVTGCSRTDSGVHAKQFFCTVDGPITVPCDRIPAALNTKLSDDIAVRSAVAVPSNFHPRYSCLGKEYLYEICTSVVRDPLSLGRAWQLCRPLDVTAMNQAAQSLVGTHDFLAFCASGSSVVDTVRTVQSVLVEQCGESVSISVSADGFLYNMVRIIVGTLTDVGLGKTAPETVVDILLSKDRSKAGVTAPACGLYLNRVLYEFN